MKCFYFFRIQWTRVHIGQNSDLTRYSERTELSSSQMWHGGLVQWFRMWYAVCTLTYSQKSVPHRPR